jgi:hypothetical protein
MIKKNFENALVADKNKSDESFRILGNPNKRLSKCGGGALKG